MTANDDIVARISGADPWLVDLVPAGEVSDLGARELLHAGPPLAGWDEAKRVGALRGAILGALVHLGWAGDLNEAEAAAAGGEIALHPANDAGGGGTYAGVIARETPVLVVENRSAGVRAFAAINEGRGQGPALRRQRPGHAGPPRLDRGRVRGAPRRRHPQVRGHRPRRDPGPRAAHGGTTGTAARRRRRPCS